MNIYPRETKEFQPVIVTVDGSNVTSHVQFCVTDDGTRPVTWTDPVELDGKIGVMLDQPPAGVYRVWAQITDSPEIPVVDCGTYRVN